MAKNIPPPYISVIVPMYKVERYIKDCIDSILNQTFQDFEIIIVDDASPDKSFDICQKLYGNNEKIRIVRHKQNKGLGPSRNTGIENARGKYVYFVDSDDLILPNALEIIHNTAQNTNAEVIHTGAYYETTQDDNRPINQQNLKNVVEYNNKEGFLESDIPTRLRKYYACFDMHHMAWTYAVSREFLRKSKLEFLPIISEDEPFCFDLLCCAKKFFIVLKAVYIYRKRENSIMKSYDNSRFAKGIKSFLIVPPHMQRQLKNISDDISLQDKVIGHFLNLQNINHVLPFYDGQTIDKEIDQIIINEFKSIFKEHTAFVRFFFNRANSFHKHLALITGQQNSANQKNEMMQALANEKEHMLKLIDDLRNTEKKFIFMLTPTHGNLGDQAIVLGEYFIMQSCFPNHKIIEIPYDYMVGNLGKIFSGLGYQKYLRPQDDIVLHGGGNMGNIWIHEEIARRAVIEKFPNNRIVSFPQSVHFTDDAEGQKQAAISSKIYNAHKDLHLMLRDEHSFEVANKLFQNAKTYLLPDIVTALFGTLDRMNAEREGVLFVLRNDKEKVRNDKTIERLQDYLNKKNIPFALVDNVIDERITAENRVKKVMALLVHFRKSKLVITDRFHGVIFSVITRTPVMAFKSYDTKISSGLKWFKDFPSVYYAENNSLDEMINFFNKAYNGEFSDSLTAPPPFGVDSGRLCKEIFHG